MKKLRLKRWTKILITLIVIHISFFIWKQTGYLGELARKDTVYLILCIASWIYLIIGQALIYEELWKK